MLVAMLAGVARGDGTPPALTVNGLSMPPGTTASLIVSGEITGQSTFGVSILVEIVPQPGTTGAVQFTPEPPVDILQIGDPWPDLGIYSPFDTAAAGSTALNGSVDDNGSLLPEPITFAGELSAFPVMASFDASGTWDVILFTDVGASSWEGLATKLVAGTITVGCGQDIQCDDGAACTLDTCESGQCVFSPNNADCVDDGIFCNGAEICDPAIGDPATGCTSSGPPCPDCTEEFGCACQPPVVEAVGGKYIRVSPTPGDSTTPMAIVVTCTGGTSRYVGPLPKQQSALPFDLTNDGTIDATVAALVNSPANALFLTPAQWLSDVYVTGELMIPSTEYAVQIDCGVPGSPVLTDPVTVTTWTYGEVFGDPPVTLADAFAAILAFQGSYETAEGPTIIPNMDVDFCLPNQIISLADAFRIVQAFQGATYAESYGGTNCVLSCP